MTGTEEKPIESKCPTIMVWVCGWKRIKDTRGKQNWVILAMDARSRFIPCFGIYHSPSAENTLTTLINGIQEYGVPRGIITNNKAPFIAPPALSEDGYLFEKFIQYYHIQHFQMPEIRQRLTTLWRIMTIHQSQFSSLDDFVYWYNTTPNKAIGFALPIETFYQLPKGSVRCI